MAQYHHLQPYFCLSLPQLDLGGNPTHLPPRGTPLEPPNNQQYAHINSFSFPLSTWLVRLWQTYSCLSLPMLDLGEESHPPATQGLAEVGCDRHRVVGGGTGPRVPHTSHVFGNKEKLLIWAYCWLFWGSGGVPLGDRWVIFPP